MPSVLKGPPSKCKTEKVTLADLGLSSTKLSDIPIRPEKLDIHISHYIRQLG